MLKADTIIIASMTMQLMLGSCRLSKKWSSDDFTMLTNMATTVVLLKNELSTATGSISLATAFV